MWVWRGMLSVCLLAAVVALTGLAVRMATRQPPATRTYRAPDQPSCPPPRDDDGPCETELRLPPSSPDPLILCSQEPPRRVVLRFRVTAYCPCEQCCGRWSGLGLTASGAPITSNGGCFVAADTNELPFGTQVMVPGYSACEPVPVLDRGGAIHNRRLDVFFPSHQQALEWGVRDLDVEIAPPIASRIAHAR